MGIDCLAVSPPLLNGLVSLTNPKIKDEKSKLQFKNQKPSSFLNFGLSFYTLHFDF